ncbi:hypothetical protein [Undibacterium sp. Di24W]|uniref:hypothetical protein n=1 Tax=Undibacterium sp. Di24W TaxID=3413033 RepID=UPI003BF2D36A
MMNIEQMIKDFERTHITMDLRRYADNTYMADATADKFNTYRSGWVDGQAAIEPKGGEPCWDNSDGKCAARCFDFPNCKCTGLEP